MASMQVFRRVVRLLPLLPVSVLVALTTTTPVPGRWVDIFGAMPQLVESYNLPGPPYTQPNVVFANTTLRQTLYLTQPATTIRIHLTNVFGGSDLPITAATVALPVNGSVSGTSPIQPATLQTLTFGGPGPGLGCTIPAGASALSDPVTLPAGLRAGTVLTLSLYLADGQATNSITGHPGSRVTTYLAPGNQVAAPDVALVAGVQTVEHWYLVAAVQAWLPRQHASLVIVGDSLTDGRGSTENRNDRWPDALLARMQLAGAGARDGDGAATTGRGGFGVADIAVVSVAAGGNRVLYDGLGPNAMGRIDRDVLARPGARYVIIYIGINDLLTAGADAESQQKTGNRLLFSYDQMITRMHAAGLAVFGATITPFISADQALDEPPRELQRQRVNAWIRGSGRYDSVLDFDAAVRDPVNATQLDPRYNSGDWLHMTPTGYRALAEAVDLGLFEKFSHGYQGML